MSLKGFLKECHEKGVFKMLSIYIVSSWVILQVLALISQPLGLPQKSITYLILILLAGFPLYILYIWKFHLAHFEKIEIELDKNGKWKKSAFQKMYYSFLVIVIAISSLSVILIINNNFSTEIKLSKVKGNDRIAVLKFENNTGIDSLDIIGKMTVDWIIHGINEHTDEKVISPKVITDYAKFNAEASSVNNIGFLKNYFNPKKIIKGEFYLDKSKFIFKCSITDGSVDNSLISFKLIECNSDSPLDCIKQLKETILGYLVFEINDEVTNYEETPPKFDAYQFVLNSREINNTDPLYIDLINKAIAADPNYFEPKIQKMSYYYNKGEFHIADSVRKSIVINSKISSRQRNYLLFYESLLRGKNDKIYTSHKKEYKIANFDLTTNMTNMNIAVQYVNRPEDVEAIFNEISMKEMSLENCTMCGFRFYLKGLADVKLNKYSQVIEMLLPVTKRIEGSLIKIPLIMAYIKSEDFTSLDNFMSKIELNDSQEDIDELSLFSGKQLLLINQKDKANDYFNKIILNKNLQTKDNDLANAFYYLESFSEAEKLFENLYKTDSTNIDYVVKLAISYFKNGKTEDANKLINTLEQLRADYQFGAIDYGLAQYHVVVGDKEKSLDYLLKSVADGNKYLPSTFQYDPHFTAIKDTKEFQHIMTFWWQ